MSPNYYISSDKNRNQPTWEPPACKTGYSWRAQ